MRHHFCGHAVQAAISRFFAPRGCYPSMVGVIAEGLLVLTLSFSLLHRHRAELCWSKKNRKAAKAEQRKLCIVPYEALLLAAVTGLHWLGAVYVPLLEDTIEEPEKVLGGFNMTDSFTIGILGYFVLLDLVESHSFKKYVLRPYYQKKTILPVTSDEDAVEELDEKKVLSSALKRSEKEGLIDAEESSPMLPAELPAEPTPAPRRNLFQRLRVAVQKSRERELKRLTAANIVARYHSRALSKVVISVAFLWQAIYTVCSLAPEDYLNSRESILPLTIAFSLLSAIRFVHVVAQGFKFAKREGL